MISNFDHTTLQQLWWVICSVVGALFLFLTFVQGGQTLLWQVAKTNTESSLIISSLKSKWELTFTTLVLFGGALFASFPKFYATSFGGAYWVWMLILFTFVLQAVSFEFRKRPGNLFGKKLYELFLFLNGTVGILLIGAAVGTFYTGANYSLNDFNQVSWKYTLGGINLRGLEAAFSFFNVSLGLFLVFNARVLGALYFLNNLELSRHSEMESRLRLAVRNNFVCSLPFLLYVLVAVLLMKGFHVDESGVISIVSHKYLANLLALPHLLFLLLVGIGLVIYGVVAGAFENSTKGIWSSGLGTVLVGLCVLCLPAFNSTSFYPSKVDLQSSLTIYNASSSHFTLVTMTYVALAIPFVLGYITYVWKQMDSRKISESDVAEGEDY